MPAVRGFRLRIPWGPDGKRRIIRGWGLWDWRPVARVLLLDGNRRAACAGRPGNRPTGGVRHHMLLVQPL